MASLPNKPSRAELAAAVGTYLPDILDHGLDVLFCGINPGLYSAAVGHHFARPGNRFWPALHHGGFTDRLYHPAEDETLLALGLGLTNLIDRATATAEQLEAREFEEGGRRLETKAKEFRPRWIAILGIGAYRTAFGKRRAALGEQPDLIGGARVWVLPNPSGLNAHHQPKDLANAFASLRAAVSLSTTRSASPPG